MNLQKEQLVSWVLICGIFKYKQVINNYCAAHLLAQII